MKVKNLLLAVIPLFGIGLTTALTISNNDSEEVEARTFTGGKKHLLGKYSTDPKSEPEYSTQQPFNFAAMNIGDTWNNNRGENVVVAVIDSGANIYHEDFLKPEAQGKTITSSNVEQYSILSPKSCKIYDTGNGTTTSTVKTLVGISNCLDTDTYDSTYREYYSHGTCTASCIGAAVNSVGGTGIAPNVELMVINCDLYDSSIDVAIRYAADNGADVISMSFGAYDITDYPSGEKDYAYEGCSTSMQSAINYAYSKDVVCVASAGNESQGSHHSYPACNEHVIGVGALERKSLTEIADFSCWNVVTNGVIDENNNADVFAPGYVWTAGVEDKSNTKDVYIETQGTSFSCPLTAGAIALYRSAYPDATVDEVTQALFDSCYDLGTAGRDKTYGYGRVDVEKFLTTSDLKGLTIAPTSTTLTINEDGSYNTQQFSLTFDPVDCDEEFKQGIWVSNDEDICTVDDNGLVTPVSGGTTKIGYLPGKGSKYVEATVTVVDHQNHPVQSISLDKTSAEIAIDGTVTLTPTFNPRYASNKNVTWSSNNEAVATVNDGVVHGLTEGTAIITVTSQDGNKTASCTVEVKKVISKTSTIGFEGTGKTDNSTASTDSELMNALSDTTDTSIISSISNAKKIYLGADGWKMGASREIGKFTINFKNTLNIKSITFHTSKYGDDKGVINVTAGSSTYGTVTPSEGTTTITKDASALSLTLATSSKRAYIYDIDIVHETTGGTSETISVTGVSLNKTSASLTVGDTLSLTPTISPSNATNKTVSWSSSNASVATVNNGVVTAVGAGSATITVTTADGNKTATCNVTVTSGGSTTVSVTGITLNPTSATLEVGDTKSLTYTIAPSNATNKNVSWSSNNTTVATVNNGVVTAKAVGSATITVTTADGNKTATCAITVKAASSEKVDGLITFDSNGESGDSTTELDGTGIMGIISNDSDTSFVKNISDTTKCYHGIYGLKLGTRSSFGGFTINFTKSLKISSITVTSKKYSTDAGTINLTVGSTSYGAVTPTSSASSSTVTKNATGSSLTVATSTGRTNIFSLKIVFTEGSGGDETINVTGVSLNQTSANLKVGQTLTLNPTVAPSNATNKNVSWSSSNTSVATVNNGVVTAVGVGSATITVTTADGNKTASCNVTVTDNGGQGGDVILVNSISFSSMFGQIKVGSTLTLTPIIGPDNATNKNVIWTTSNEEIAVVNNGIVTGLKEGTCVIIATAADGSGKAGYFSVTVTNKETNTEDKSSQGCGGSIIASSAILCGLSFIGAALLIAKRKKEN